MHMLGVIAISLHISLHWLKIIRASNTKSSLSHLHNTSISKTFLSYHLLNLQANTSTHSSTVITLQRPPVNSCLKITDISFTYHPALWNSLPKDRRYPLSHTSSSNLSHSTNHHLALSASQFHSKLKRLISNSTNHSRPSLLAPLHSRFSG